MSWRVFREPSDVSSGFGRGTGIFAFAIYCLSACSLIVMLSMLTYTRSRSSACSKKKKTLSHIMLTGRIFGEQNLMHGRQLCHRPLILMQM